MLILQQVGHPRREFPARQQIGRRPGQPQETQRRLLPDLLRGRRRHQHALHFDVHRLDELEPRDVGQRAQRQALHGIVLDGALGLLAPRRIPRARREVRLQRANDAGHDGVAAAEQQAERRIADDLLGVLCRSDQGEDLGVAEVHFVAQHVDVDELPDVLLALVGRQRWVGAVGGKLGVAGVELLADFGEFHFHAVRFFFSRFAVAQVADEVVQPAGLGRHCFGAYWQCR
mmetsp:Transcript_1096/g.2379  ORF Transcript_1096/g.2379 Transcript_1096/m.2379 type:complete len:230 (+) Transcript_1096:846-1535(+)